MTGLAQKGTMLCKAKTTVTEPEQQTISKISQIHSLTQIVSRLSSMKNKLHGLENSGYTLILLCILSQSLLLTSREKLILFNSHSHQCEVVLHGDHKMMPQAKWMPSKYFKCWYKCLWDHNPA